jgi:TonB-dependent starch-binding outer membrane protein SusC
MKHSLLLWLFVAISVVPALAQTRTIKGKVTDAKDGSGVPFATIKVEGSKSGTVTDQNGNFSINVDGDQTLVISSVGFTSKKVKATEGPLSISLTAGDNVLEEVIATGYTNTSRRKGTSAVGEITADKINNSNYIDINQTLQGQTPGVFVGGSSGMPGAVQAVRIRGIGSITGGASPLYVVDGTPIDGRDLNNTSALGLQSNDILANLNPNDVESVTVLKDAAATALYGSRAANGVIVINTKKGKNGVTTFGARAQYGKAKASFGKAKLMTAAEALKYDRDVMAINGYSQADIDDNFPTSLLDHSFDWWDAAFQTATIQSYGINATGGTDKTKFYLSGSYDNQQGTQIYSGVKKYSILSNITQKVNERMDVSLNLNLTNADYQSNVGGSYYSSPIIGAFFISPFQSPYKADGTLYTGLEDEFVNNSGTGDNFLYSQPRNPKGISNTRGLGSFAVSYKLFPFLKIQEKASMDMTYGIAKLFYDPTTGDGFNASDPTQSGTIDNQSVKATNLNNQLSASGGFDLGKDHKLDYTAIMEYTKYQTDNFLAEGKGLASGALKALDVAAIPNAVGGNGTSYTFLSYLGQVNYSFKDRYNLSGSIRTDGSSKFGANHRFGTFYSVGASWIVTEEPFMDAQKIFTDLKVRGSYGITGNADFGSLDNFVATQLYSYAAAYAGAPGSAPSTIGNKDLTWEKNKNANIGLDMGFLDNRLTATVDVYKRQTSGLLFSKPVSSTSGFQSQLTNIGSIQNKGIEALITSKNFDNGNGFSWTTTFNFTMNRNKIVELYNHQDITGSISIQREGEHVTSWYMAQWAGVDPANGDPLWKTADGKTTNSLNSAVRKVSGSAEPRYIGGLTNTFSYKGVALSVFFYGVTGNKVLDQTRILSDADGTYFGLNYSQQAGENYWRKAGDHAERPKPKIGGNRNANSAQSTRFLEDGQFLRLKNITLSYNLPQSVLRSAKIQNVRIFAEANNLVTWTKYTGWDPEQDASANEFFRYPPDKGVTVGLNLNF